MTFAEFEACLRGHARAQGVKPTEQADYDAAYAALAYFEAEEAGAD